MLLLRRLILAVELPRALKVHVGKQGSILGEQRKNRFYCVRRNILKIKTWSKLVTSLVVGGMSASAVIADPWTGKGELGYVLVEGNTTSEVLNLGLEFEKIHDKWKHLAKVDAVESRSDDEQLTKSNGASWRSEYSFSERTFGFGEASYLNDRFDSFENIYTVAVGAGYKVIMQENLTWDLSAGAGYRATKTVDAGGLTEDIGSIAYLLTSDYKHQLTESTSFENLTKFLIAKDDTYSTNVASLSVSINASLALKLKHDVRHHSDPEPGFKSVDRITSVNVVYSF